MTSPPMFDGRKLLANVAARYEFSSVPKPHLHVLGVEQHPPAPGGHEQHHKVDREGDGDPTKRRAAHQLPELGEIDAREQDVQQSRADADLEDPHDRLRG